MSGRRHLGIGGEQRAVGNWSQCRSSGKRPFLMITLTALDRTSSKSVTSWRPATTIMNEVCCWLEGVLCVYSDGWRTAYRVQRSPTSPVWVTRSDIWLSADAKLPGPAPLPGAVPCHVDLRLHHLQRSRKLVAFCPLFFQLPLQPHSEWPFTLCPRQLGVHAATNSCEVLMMPLALLHRRLLHHHQGWEAG